MKSSYGSILRSSSLIGGSQLVIMLVGIIRTKFAAILLGPAGVGLVGTYAAMQQFVSALAGMGINQSGVRDISEARGTGDLEKLAKTISVLRRISLWLGLMGALILAGLAWPLSRLTFGDDQHVLGIMALGVAVCLGLVSAAQSAVLQGFRQIANMAKAGIYGLLVGAPVSICWYYYWGIEGIIPAILTQSVLSLILTWKYAKNVDVPRVSLDLQQMIPHAKSLFGLGLAMMWNGLLIAMMAYVIRMLILQEFDLAAVGVYSAAYGISGMVVNFVLGAMGADYFPRLSEVHDDHPRMVQLVNEQTEIGVLLTLPAISALIVTAPWLIRLLYTSEFVTAVPMVQWFAIGCFGRVIQWPLGFVLLAKKKGRLFAGSQSLFQLMHLFLVYFGMNLFGLEGVAMAFMLLYMFTFWIILWLIKRLINFQWSYSAKTLLLMSMCVMLGVFVFAQNVTGQFGAALGFILSVVVGVFCLRSLVKRIGRENQLVLTTLRVLPILDKLL